MTTRDSMTQGQLFEEETPPPPPTTPTRDDQQGEETSIGPRFHGHKTQRLEEMGLAFGATWVYRFAGQVYAAGDFNHCPREDIEQNIRVLTQILISKNLQSATKDYNDRLYLGGQRKTEIKQALTDLSRLYHETVYFVDHQGNITGEAKELMEYGALVEQVSRMLTDLRFGRENDWAEVQRNAESIAEAAKKLRELTAKLAW